MLKVITKGVRSAVLAAAVLSPAWALADSKFDSPFAAPAVTAPAAESVLSHESLKTQLDGLGYEYKVETSTAATPIYTLDFQQGNFRYVIRVALTTDSKTLFLDAPLKQLPTTEPVPVERIIRILEENSRITPSAFRYEKSENRLYLTRGIENKDMNPGRLRKMVGDFMQVLSDSQPLWNPTKWEPVPTAVPAAPAAPAVSMVDPASDLGRMQGKWTVKSGTVFGQQVTDDASRKIGTITLNNQTYVMLETTFNMEVDAVAKTVTFTNAAGGKELGIYRIEGDEFVMHVAKPGQSRPTDFNPTAETYLLTLQRVTAPAGVASAK